MGNCDSEVATHGNSTCVVVEWDVPARMRDGTILRANIYRPATAGRYPVLLARSPYGKDLPTIVEMLDPVQTARQGFIVVIQDTRGRFKSEGLTQSFRFERNDGYDTIEWAATLPSSNGRVGMFGGSYVGNTQWMPALDRPPSLAAISPIVSWSDPMDGVFARGGALELGIEMGWTLLMGPDYVQRLPLREQERSDRIGAILNEFEALAFKGYWDLPVKGGDALSRHKLPAFGAIRALDDPDTIGWCRVSGHHERVIVPTFHTGGWYDAFLQGTLDNFEAMRRLGRDARLVVGPWSHSEYGDTVGDLRFGLSSRRVGVPVHPYGDLNAYQLAWFRQHLDPDSKVRLPDARVRIFVMGRNQWRDENEWPLARAKDRRHFLRADGSLTLASPSSDEPATEFIYDPAKPVPTVGGHLVMFSAFPPGPKDQGIVEARTDVCTFTSDPLAGEVEVTGRVRVVLSARSSAPSTDWVARLCDVHPDGKSYNICDGIVRVPEGADATGTWEIDLWSTSNVFRPGHRIRVQITSSSFPRWDRNLNTGNQESPQHQIARQQILHNCERPSFIVLPIVEK